MDKEIGSSLSAQKVKDGALSLQLLGSLLWCRFDPQPRTFHILQVWPKKKKKKKRKKEKKFQYTLTEEYCSAIKRMKSCSLPQHRWILRALCLAK